MGGEISTNVRNEKNLQFGRKIDRKGRSEWRNRNIGLWSDSLFFEKYDVDVQVKNIFYVSVCEVKCILVADVCCQNVSPQLHCIFCHKISCSNGLVAGLPFRKISR